MQLGTYIGLAITLSSNFTGAVDGGVVSNWILATGFWDDNGVWDDEAIWID